MGFWGEDLMFLMVGVGTPWVVNAPVPGVFFCHF